MTSFTLIILLLLSPRGRGNIEITEGPDNITVFVGESVTIPCLYTGTVEQPNWKVGTDIFSSSNPPAGYEYTNEGLHIPSVWALLNNTYFGCFFAVHVGGGRFENIESQPAFITVRIRYIPTTVHISPSNGISPTFSAVATNSRHILTTLVGQSKTTPGRPLYTSSSPSVASTHEMSTPSPTLPVPQPPFIMTSAVPLIGGITFGVGVSFLLVAIIIASMCLFICRHVKQVSENTTSEQEVNMQENPAYETPPSRIHMKKNEAYSTVTFQSGHL